MQARKVKHGVKGVKRQVVRPLTTAKKPSASTAAHMLKAAPISERLLKSRKESIGAVEGLTIYKYAADRANAIASKGDNRSSDEILAMVAAIAGSKAKARNWYRTFPIPAFGGVTAEFLVGHGRAKEVRDYLNSVVLGEFA